MYGPGPGGDSFCLPGWVPPPLWWWGGVPPPPLWDVGVVGQELRKEFLILLMSELFQLMTCSFFDVSDLDPPQAK